MWAGRNSRDLDRVSSIRQNLLQSAAWPRSLAIGMLTAGLAAPAGLAISVMTADEAAAACVVIVAGLQWQCANASAAISVTPIANGWLFDVEQTAPVNNTTVTGNTIINNTNVGADFNGTFTQAVNTLMTNAGTVLTFNNTAAGARDSIVTVNLNGTITSTGAATDATNFTNGGVYNINIGPTGSISATDDGIVVRQIDIGVTVNNQGSITTTNGGGGGNLDDGILVALNGAPGSNVDGYATVINTGTINATAGSGVNLSANGAIQLTNSGAGNINGGQGATLHGGSTVTVDNSAHIEGTTGNGLEISAATVATVTNSTAASLIGATNGLHIHNVGSIVFNNLLAPSSGLTQGLNGAGFLFDNVTGTVLVNNNQAGATITGTNDGIRSGAAVVGDVTIHNDNGGIISGTGGATSDGIDLSAGVTNNITITNTAGGSITGNSQGINALSTAGDITVNSTGGSITATNNEGVIATTNKAAGLIDLDIGTLTANNGHGVIATATNGATTINIDVHTSLNAGANTFEDGIRATGSTTSNVNITNRDGATINGGDDGIIVLQGGTIHIVNGIGSTIASNVGPGVPTNGSEAIIVAAGGNPGSGTGGGRVAGTVTVDNSGLIVSNDTFGTNGEAINISSVGNVRINNLIAAATIRGSAGGGNGSGAIEVDTAGTFRLDNAGLVEGAGLADSDGPVIDLHVAGGSTINNLAGGVIQSADSDPSKLIIRSGGDGSAIGSANVINNNGTMLGNIQLVGSFNDTFNNMSATTWEFTGTSDFGAGDTDTLNNTGQIRPIATATINGLEFFNNGAPGFGNNGYINQRDGVVGDVFTVNPTGGEMLVYYGDPGNNWLLQDVDLGDFGESLADKFKINGDVNPTGSTGIVVDDLNNFAGAYNPNGITVVDVTGTTGLGDFFLQHGPINKGLWTYDLFLNPGNTSGPEAPGASKNCDGTDNCWVIASYLDNYSIPQTMGIVQGMWHDGTWIERASDLRTVYGSNGGAGADLTYEAPVSVPTVHSGNSGIWGRVIGQIANRDVSYETEPFPYQFVTVDADYEEHFGAVQGGIDHAFDHGNGTTVVGLLAGYAHNSVDFIDAGDTAKITAPHVGAYVNWLNGGTYVDAMVKADFLTVDFNVAGEDATTKGHSLGGRLEAGHRSQMGHAFVEPVAMIAYVRTQLDPVTIGMTDVTFEDGQSLRGKVGGRVGFTTMSNGMQVDPYVHAYVGSEFLGKNTVFFDSGPGLTVVDDVSGIFGEVGGGFNLTTEDKHTSFYGQANYIFADGYHAGNATVGARVNW